MKASRSEYISWTFYYVYEVKNAGLTKTLALLTELYCKENYNKVDLLESKTCFIPRYNQTATFNIIFLLA